MLSLFLLPLLPRSSAGAQAKDAPPYAVMAPVAEYRIADAKDEIALARTAAPPSISANATVLVLGTRGYETAVKGGNGFVCFVERSWDAGFDDPEFWNPKTRGPDCLNAAAVRSVLPQFMKRTEWALAGLDKVRIMAKVREALASHEFVEPEAGSLSFMLSKQGYLNGADGPWLPHVMYFVPHGQAALWGAGLEGSPVIGKDGGPLEPTVLVVPVRRWSDGSTALPKGEHQHH
ncbi:MAG TPA: hypothetical protein VGJ82_12955 [Thermoanaerobaculia bacterium]